jgi:hypothetical protein
MCCGSTLQSADCMCLWSRNDLARQLGGGSLHQPVEVVRSCSMQRPRAGSQSTSLGCPWRGVVNNSAASCRTGRRAAFTTAPRSREELQTYEVCLRFSMECQWHDKSGCSTRPTPPGSQQRPSSHSTRPIMSGLNRLAELCFKTTRRATDHTTRRRSTSQHTLGDYLVTISGRG